MCYKRQIFEKAQLIIYGKQFHAKHYNCDDITSKRLIVIHLTDYEAKYEINLILINISYIRPCDVNATN